jgi:malic enzyme
MTSSIIELGNFLLSIAAKRISAQEQTDKEKSNVRKFNDFKEGDAVVVTATRSLAIEVAEPQK